MAARAPHVALLIETSRSYGRQLLRGVRQYISEHGPWSVFLEPRDLQSKPPPWLGHWPGHGILVRTENASMARAVRSTGLPAVELRASRVAGGLPFVGVDNRSMGQLVADHLLERGFRNFGVFELDTQEYFEQRRKNFVEAVSSAGCSCSVFSAAHRETPALWENQQNRLARWVRGLRKPVGIFACTDVLGFWVLDACGRAGVSVPEEAAVVGVENDQTMCTMASPPLSSVRMNGERIGYEAARLLEKLMSGGTAPRRPILIEPLGVVTRQSSDTIAVEDKALALALRFMREHACDGITVEDVLAAVPMSRSTLERRMRAIVGRSPKHEILRVQLGRVEHLMFHTNLPLDVIATKSGFRHPQYLHAVFKRHFGQAPGAFRTRMAGTGAAPWPGIRSPVDPDQVSLRSEID